MKQRDLTERQLEIIKLKAQGLIDKEIAQKLKISVRTVQTYNTQIYIKLCARNKSHAVANFLKRKISPEQVQIDTDL